MSGVMAKSRVLFLATIHSLLDKGLDLNSPQVVKQYVRDLGNAQEQLANEAAGAQGDVSITQRHINETTTKRDEAEHNVDLIIGNGDPTDDHLAEPIAAKVLGYNKEIERLTEEKAALQKVAHDLAQASSRVSTKYEEMLSLQRQLESTARSTEVKNDAAEALTAATSAAGNIDVDSVRDRIERQGAVADAKLARAMGTMADGVDLGVVGVQAKDYIAKRRAELAAKTSNSTTETASAT